MRASRPAQVQLPATHLPVARWTVDGASRRDRTEVSLPVAAIGVGDAPAVVLAHGVGSSGRFVAAACAAPLVEAGYRLVVVDQRGHGGATPCPDPDDHGLDTHASDLRAVVRSVPGEVAVVGGISLGAHAAVRAELPHPRLLALPGWTGPRRAGHGPHAAIAAEVRAHGVASLTDRLRGDDGLPSWLRATLVTDYDRHDPASLAAALVALDGADGPTFAELDALAGPGGPGLTLVAWPDDPGHPLAVAEAWATRTGAPLTRLHLTDPDQRLTRFGEALATALQALPAAWPDWATAAIEVVEADPAWPDAARALIAELRRNDVLRHVRIEHVGSTAVPGLSAKPTLDLLADVPLERADEVTATLAADGWARIPDPAVLAAAAPHTAAPSTADRLWKRSLALPRHGRRRAHLHLVSSDDPRFAAHLAFRDALRADDELADRYAALKVRLAGEHRSDREAYTDAKAAFIASVLDDRGGGSPR